MTIATLYLTQLQADCHAYSIPVHLPSHLGTMTDQRGEEMSPPTGGRLAPDFQVKWFLWQQSLRGRINCRTYSYDRVPNKRFPCLRGERHSAENLDDDRMQNEVCWNLLE
jgi:hypothetical protein